MAIFPLRSSISKMLPDGLRERLRPLGYGVLGLLSSKRLKYAIRERRTNGRLLKIVISAGSSVYEEWIATDVYVLDVCSPENWALYFEPNSIDAMLSEHVLEHLSLEDNRTALSSAFHYLKPGGYFRIAVPDGSRKDNIYQMEVAPPADDHKMLFTLNSLTSLLNEVGFSVKPLEYFDENEVFQTFEWFSRDGHVSRSVRHDRQDKFRRGDLYYTSLIVDAIKP